MEASKGTGRARQTYDVPLYAEKARAALQRLKASERPGESRISSRKTDVLLAIEKDIKEMIDAGYSPEQIARALSDDAFRILPKSITQILSRNRTTRTTSSKRRRNRKDSGAPG